MPEWRFHGNSAVTDDITRRGGDSKLLTEQAQGPVGEEGHPSSKQCDPQAELADSRNGSNSSTENTHAPDVSHFLRVLTSSLPWDQRDIPSSESAECRLHFPQVGELGTHLCRPGAHTEIPDLSWAPLPGPESQNGAPWWAQTPFSSLLSTACVGGPMIQQGVPPLCH